MRMRGLAVSRLAALYLAAVAGACRSRDDQAGLDLDAQVLQALKAHEDQFFQSMRRCDVKTMVEVYTDDAISLAPGAPIVRGKAGARGVLDPLPSGGLERGRRPRDGGARARGGLLYKVSTYVQKIHWKNGKVTKDRAVQFVGPLDAKGMVLEINKVALGAVGIELSDVEGKPAAGEVRRARCQGMIGDWELRPGKSHCSRLRCASSKNRRLAAS